MHDDRLDQPLRWRKPRLVFVNSMSDLYHPNVSTEFVDKVFATMILAERHVFQILTKRPVRMAKYLESGAKALIERWSQAARERFSKDCTPEYPPQNVWLGTSVEGEKTMSRIDVLRTVDAQVRFLSLEPLLGPLPDLNLDRIDWVIVGGESGAQARPMKKEWVVSIRDQCQVAGIPFFFKQWGGRHCKEKGRMLDGKTWSEMPYNLDDATD